MKYNTSVFQKEELKSTPGMKGYSIFSLTNEKDSKKDPNFDSHNSVPLVQKTPSFSKAANLQSFPPIQSIPHTQILQQAQTNRQMQHPQSISNFHPLHSLYSSVNKNDNLSEDQSCSSNVENINQNELIYFF